MAFFASAIDTLKILVIALGAGLGAWGVINLLEGYGNDNPGAKSQGMKQLMAGGGIALVGATLIPLLSDFNEKNAFDIEKFLSTKMPMRPGELYRNYEVTAEDLEAPAM